jgi:hypothetical protein
VKRARGRPVKLLPPDVGELVDVAALHQLGRMTKFPKRERYILRSIVDDMRFVAAMHFAVRRAVYLDAQMESAPSPADLARWSDRVVDAASGSGADLSAVVAQIPASWFPLVAGAIAPGGDPAELAKSAAKRAAILHKGANSRARLRELLQAEVEGVFASFGLWTGAHPGEKTGRVSDFVTAMTIALSAAGIRPPRAESLGSKIRARQSQLRYPD